MVRHGEAVAIGLLCEIFTLMVRIVYLRKLKNFEIYKIPHNLNFMFKDHSKS